MLMFLLGIAALVATAFCAFFLLALLLADPLGVLIALVILGAFVWAVVWALKDPRRRQAVPATSLESPWLDEDTPS